MRIDLIYINERFLRAKKIPHEAGLRVGEGGRALEFAHVKAEDGSADHFDGLAGIQLDRPVLWVV